MLEFVVGDEPVTGTYTHKLNDEVELQIVYRVKPMEREDLLQAMKAEGIDSTTDAGDSRYSLATLTLARELCLELLSVEANGEEVAFRGKRQGNPLQNFKAQIIGSARFPGLPDHILDTADKAGSRIEDERGNLQAVQG